MCESHRLGVDRLGGPATALRGPYLGLNRGVWVSSAEVPGELRGYLIHNRFDAYWRWYNGVVGFLFSGGVCA